MEVFREINFHYKLDYFPPQKEMWLDPRALLLLMYHLWMPCLVLQWGRGIPAPAEKEDRR